MEVLSENLPSLAEASIQADDCHIFSLHNQQPLRLISLMIEVSFKIFHFLIFLLELFNSALTFAIRW